MQEEVTSNTKTFFIVFILLSLMAIGFTYYKYIVLKDFTVSSDEATAEVTDMSLNTEVTQ